MMQHEVTTPALLEQQAKRSSLADAQGKTRVCTSPRHPYLVPSDHRKAPRSSTTVQRDSSLSAGKT